MRVKKRRGRPPLKAKQPYLQSKEVLDALGPVSVHDFLARKRAEYLERVENGEEVEVEIHDPLEVVFMCLNSEHLKIQMWASQILIDKMYANLKSVEMTGGNAININLGIGSNLGWTGKQQIKSDEPSQIIEPQKQLERVIAPQKPKRGV